MYGEPASDGKSVVWDRLTSLGVGRSEPWSIIGDFNEILNNDEKLGGPRRSESSFKPFAEMLSSCQMEELSSKGNRFIWAGKRWKKYIPCCLDRCFGNRAWRASFPNSNQTFVEKRGSEHRPVWVNLRANPAVQRGQFRFDRRLLHHPDALKEIVSSWKNNKGGVSVSLKIRRCRKVMSIWKRKKRVNAQDKIKSLQERLEWFQSKPYSCWFVIQNIKKELMQAYKEEEMFWRQKSRDKWLKLGDRNSKFFHLSVKVNRLRLHLVKLKDKEGRDQ